MDVFNSVVPTQSIADSRNAAEASEFSKVIESAAQQSEPAVQDLQSTFETVAMSFLQPIIMDTLDLLSEDDE
jgi:hypothetical protein